MDGKDEGGRMPAEAPEKPVAEVTLRTDEEAEDFLATARQKFRDSRRSGGRYSCGIEDESGKVVVHFHVPCAGLNGNGRAKRRGA